MKTSSRIRRLESYKDLQEILNLQYIVYESEVKLFGDPNISPLTQTLQGGEAEFERGIFLKMHDDAGRIVASVRAFSYCDTSCIGKLIVHPDLQGQGIGTTLLNEIEHICPSERYELFMSTKSERNIKLYERLGYVKFKEENVSDGLTFVYLRKT